MNWDELFEDENPYGDEQLDTESINEEEPADQPVSTEAVRADEGRIVGNRNAAVAVQIFEDVLRANLLDTEQRRNYFLNCSMSDRMKAQLFDIVFTDSDSENLFFITSRDSYTNSAPYYLIQNIDQIFGRFVGNTQLIESMIYNANRIASLLGVQYALQQQKNQLGEQNKEVAFSFLTEDPNQVLYSNDIDTAFAFQQRQGEDFNELVATNWIQAAVKWGLDYSRSYEQKHRGKIETRIQRFRIEPFDMLRYYRYYTTYDLFISGRESQIAAICIESQPTKIYVNTYNRTALVKDQVRATEWTSEFNDTSAYYQSAIDNFNSWLQTSSPSPPPSFGTVNISVFVHTVSLPVTTLISMSGSSVAFSPTKDMIKTAVQTVQIVLYTCDTLETIRLRVAETLNVRTSALFVAENQEKAQFVRYKSKHNDVNLTYDSLDPNSAVIINSVQKYKLTFYNLLSYYDVATSLYNSLATQLNAIQKPATFDNIFPFFLSGMNTLISNNYLLNVALVKLFEGERFALSTLQMQDESALNKERIAATLYIVSDFQSPVSIRSIVNSGKIRRRATFDATANDFDPYVAKRLSYIVPSNILPTTFIPYAEELIQTKQKIQGEFHLTNMDIYGMFDNLIADEAVPFIRLGNFVKVSNGFEAPDSWCTEQDKEDVQDVDSLEDQDETEDTPQVQTTQTLTFYMTFASIEGKDKEELYQKIVVRVVKNKVNNSIVDTTYKFVANVEVSLQATKLVYQMIDFLKRCNIKLQSMIINESIGKVVTAITNVTINLPMIYDFALNHPVISRVISLQESRIIHRRNNRAIRFVLRNTVNTNIMCRCHMYLYSQRSEKKPRYFPDYRRLFSVREGDTIWGIEFSSIDNYELEMRQIKLLYNLLINCLRLIDQERESWFMSYYSVLAYDIRQYVKDSDITVAQADLSSQTEPSIVAPEVYTSGTAKVCQVNVQPKFKLIRGNDIDAAKREFEAQFSSKTVPNYIIYPPLGHYNKALQTVPEYMRPRLKNQRYLVYSPSSSRPYVGLTKNSSSVLNYEIFPYIPCSQSAKSDDYETYKRDFEQDSNKSLYDWKVSEDKPNTTTLFSSNKILLDGEIAKLQLTKGTNERIFKMLCATDQPDEDGHSVLDGTYTYIKMGVDDEFGRVKQCRVLSALYTLYKKKQDVALLSMLELRNKLREISKQGLLQMCGITTAEALHILDTEQYIDPMAWVPVLRKVFEFEIILFEQDLEKNLSGSIAPTKFKRVRLINEIAPLYPTTVFLFVHRGAEKEYNDNLYPITEIIGKLDMTDTKNKKTTFLFPTNSQQVVNLNNILNELYPPVKANFRLFKNDLVKVASQGYDVYGKTRFIKVKDGVETLMIDPCNNIPSLKSQQSFTPAQVDYLTARDYLQASKALVLNQKVVALITSIASNKFLRCNLLYPIQYDANVQKVLRAIRTLDTANISVAQEYVATSLADAQMQLKDPMPIVLFDEDINKEKVVGLYRKRADEVGRYVSLAITSASFTEYMPNYMPEKYDTSVLSYPAPIQLGKDVFVDKYYFFRRLANYLNMYMQWIYSREYNKDPLVAQSIHSFVSRYTIIQKGVGYSIKDIETRELIDTNDRILTNDQGKLKLIVKGNDNEYCDKLIAKLQYALEQAYNRNTETLKNLYQQHYVPNYFETASEFKTFSSCSVYNSCDQYQQALQLNAKKAYQLLSGPQPTKDSYFVKYEDGYKLAHNFDTYEEALYVAASFYDSRSIYATKSQIDISSLPLRIVIVQFNAQSALFDVVNIEDLSMGNDAAITCVIAISQFDGKEVYTTLLDYTPNLS